MITWKNVSVKLGELKPWEENPRFSTKEQAQRLIESWKEFGQVETIAIGPGNEVYDGHQRLSALFAVYGPDYEVDARQSSRELTDEERRKLVVALHSGATGDWNWDELANWDTEELVSWGMDEKALKAWNKNAASLKQMLASEEEPKEQEEEDNFPVIYRVPDAVWGSDNEYGIPLLDLSMQATCLEAPFAGWGTFSRKNKMTGTYHFYVEDYRFDNLWKHPEDVVNSACHSVVEPNFSIYDDMPRAVALYQVYKKRWISRWLQSVGVTIFVDCNISMRYADLRFIGVPKGWKAYCTRAYSDHLDETELEYLQALEHSESDSIIFVCYGGGKKAEEMSKKYNWIWYPDQESKIAEVKNG